MSGHRPRRRWLWLALAVLASVAVLFGAGMILRFKGLNTAADIAQLVSLFIPVATVAPYVLAWWRGPVRPAVATPQEVAAAKAVLASVTAEQWRAEARLRALDDPDPIPVQWKLTDRDAVMDVALNRTPGVLTVASSSDVSALIAEFRRLRRRRLVILGGAGAGKTTLAVQMLLAFVDERSPDSGEPVPVLLSVAGWDTSRHESLQDWVADRLVHEYAELSGDVLAPHVVRALATQGHILPILDGLDEAPAEVRKSVIAALNRSMTGIDQLILTSRTEAFAAAVEAAGRVLTSAVVIEPTPLTRAAAAEYLQRCLPPRPDPAWRLVLDELRSGESAHSAALAEVTTSPLGLWLIRVGYISPHADPSPLVDAERFPTTADLRSHLFDQLIAGSIEARPPSDNPADLFCPRHRYEPQDVARWLTFLAVNMDEWRSRDFDWTTDMSRLAGPARWPTAAADGLERAVPVAKRLWARLLAAPAWLKAVTAAAAVAAPFAAAIALGWIVGGLVSLPFGNAAGSAVRIWLTFAILVAVFAMGTWIVVQAWGHDDLSDVEWYPAVAEVRRRLLAVLSIVSGTAAFAAAYGLLVGLLVGVPVGAAVGRGPGWRAGLAAGAATAVLMGASCLADRRRPPGTGRRLRWYGIGLWDAVRSGVLGGVILGAIAGLTIAVVYDGGSAGLPVDPVALLVWSVMAFALAFATLFLAARLAAPVAYTVSAALTAVPRRLLRRTGGLGSGDGRDSSPAVWHHERAGQLGRFLRVGVLALVAGVAGAALWRYAVDAYGRPVLDTGAVSRWLADHPAHAVVSLSGHTRYLIAVAAGLLVTTVRESAVRRWKHWLIAGAVGAVAVWLWPASWTPDPFHVRLAVTLDEAVAHLSLHSTTQIAGSTGRVDRVDDLDLGTIQSSSSVRLAAVAVGILLLLGLVELYIGRVENGQPKLWWACTAASAPYVLRGQLPKDVLAFLDDAHRLGLMRAVGTAYQFRHAEFQDHLADATGRFGVTRRPVMRTKTGQLVTAAMDGDRAAAQRLAAIARSRPQRLLPYLDVLLEYGVAAPADLFLCAHSDLLGEIVRRIDHQEVADPRHLDQLLRVLAQADAPAVRMALRTWQTAPVPGMERLGQSPLAYAREAGWALEGGRWRRLFSDTAYALRMRPAPEDTAQPCPWCDSPLWTVFDVETDRPGVWRAVHHARWDGRLRIITCASCAEWTALYTDVTPDGDAAWSAYNRRPQSLGERVPAPTAVAEIGERRATAYLAAARQAGGSTLGGRPDWVGKPRYLDCAACGQPMDYLGLIAGVDVGRTGAYYVFLHAPCGLAAVCHQAGGDQDAAGVPSRETAEIN